MPDTAAILAELGRRGATLGTAESLTGGLVAATVTAVPGASTVFVGGVVGYAAEVKEALLGVPVELVGEHGTVSAECAGAMATGARAALGCDWALSTTGVAGPDPLEGHPVGTVFVGVAGPDGVHTRRLALAGDRDQIRRATVSAVVSALGDMLGLAREEPGLG